MKPILCTIFCVTGLLYAHFLSAQSPGGVSNGLRLWLKADSQVYKDMGITPATTGNSVVHWYDQSPDSNHATTINQVTYSSEQKNFNPTLRFASYHSYASTSVDVSSQFSYEFTVFMAFARTTSNASSSNMLNIGGNHFANSYWYRPNYGYKTGSGNFINNGSQSSQHSPVGRMYLNTVRKDSSSIGIYHQGSVQKLLGTDTSAINFSYTGSPENSFRIGKVTAPGTGVGSWGSLPMDLGEVIIYSKKLLDAEITQIQSYLALKYGITLSSSGGGTAGDYVSSTGSTIWDASLKSSYHNDVIGLGRNDTEQLLQKQSHTQDDSVTIYVSALAVTNDSNSGTITNDQSYVIVGHNNGLLKSTHATFTEKPAGIYSRLDREWKVTNTNFSDSYSIKIKLDGIVNSSIELDDLYLLVDNDGDFTDASVYGSSNVSFSLGSITISNIDMSEIPLNSTRYFTVGSDSNRTTLPIDLMSFSAQLSDQRHTKLSWETTTETNNDYFSVERSTNTIDWSEVLRQDGAGNSLTPIAYEGFDYSPLEGLSYYRLKQTDYNGQFTYSTTKVIENTLTQSDGFQIHPNPCGDKIFISSLGIDDSEISVIDALGKDITSLIEITQENESTTVLNLSNLADGLYILKTEKKTSKFYKL